MLPDPIAFAMTPASVVSFDRDECVPTKATPRISAATERRPMVLVYAAVAAAPAEWFEAATDRQGGTTRRAFATSRAHSPHGDKSRRPRFGAHAQGATSRALAKSPHQPIRTAHTGAAPTSINLAYGAEHHTSSPSSSHSTPTMPQRARDTPSPRRPPPSPPLGERARHAPYPIPQTPEKRAEFEKIQACRKDTVLSPYGSGRCRHRCG